jgi:hypothetical protein
MSDRDGRSGKAKWWLAAVIIPLIGAMPAWLALTGDEPAPPNTPVSTSPSNTTSAPPSPTALSEPSPTPSPADSQPPSIFLSKLSGPKGTKVSVSGEHFRGGEEIEVRFHTTEVGRTRANAAGVFTIEITIPGDYSMFAPSDFQIDAFGRSSVRDAKAQFRLTG